METLSFFSVEGVDLLIKYGGVGLFLLIIFAWLASHLKLQLFENGMKQDAYNALTKQLSDLRKDFDKERDKLEEAYKQRNEAISELKKWQTLAERMEGEMQEMKEELRANNEFIREVLNSIHVFSATHPHEASLLHIPTLPNTHK